MLTTLENKMLGLNFYLFKNEVSILDEILDFKSFLKRA